MATKDVELRSNVLLVFQTALLGMVPFALRAVTVGWRTGRILGHCIFDGSIGEEQIELCSDIEAEIMASFPEREIEVIAKRLDSPLDLRPELLEAWVYRRKE